MIFGCVIFYNDTPELLRSCLMSLKRFGVYSVAIDGAFEEFPHKHPESTDGCAELAAELADYYIPGRLYKNQMEKRNEYLRRIPDGYYFLVIDADEELESPLPYDLKADCYKVRVKSLKNNKLIETPYVRIFRNYYDLEYRYQHNRLYRLSRHDPEKPQSGCILDAEYLYNGSGEKISIMHNSHKRPQERILQDIEYYKNRKEKDFLNEIYKRKLNA